MIKTGRAIGRDRQSNAYYSWRRYLHRYLRNIILEDQIPYHSKPYCQDLNFRSCRLPCLSVLDKAKVTHKKKVSIRPSASPSLTYTPW